MDPFSVRSHQKVPVFESRYENPHRQELRVDFLGHGINGSKTYGTCDVALTRDGMFHSGACCNLPQSMLFNRRGGVFFWEPTATVLESGLVKASIAIYTDIRCANCDAILIR